LIDIQLITTLFLIAKKTPEKYTKLCFREIPPKARFRYIRLFGFMGHYQKTCILHVLTPYNLRTAYV